MRKWKLLIIIVAMMVICIGTAFAYPMCPETVEINENCTMHTPVVACTNYSYKIINQSNGAIMDEGVMTSLGEELYIFNFTQEEGGYVVKLCDDTTREVIVTFPGDGGMTLAAIILIPVAIAFMLLIGSTYFSDEKGWIKLVMIIGSGVSFFMSIFLGSVAVYRLYGEWSEMARALAFMAVSIGIILFIVYTLILLSVAVEALNQLRIKKNKKLGIDDDL